MKPGEIHPLVRARREEELKKPRTLELAKLIPEKVLIEELGTSRWVLAKLRERGLPSIEVVKGRRIYHEESLVLFLLSQETKATE